MRRKDKKALVICLEPEAKEQIRRWADAEGRSMANFTERIIMAYVDERKKESEDRA